jgi:hypothetical protein
VTVSQTRVHSPSGDMSARLPEGWVTLEVERLDAPQLFAVACNPEYTASLLFSATGVDNAARKGFDRSGMTGLAEASFERRRKRSDGRAQLVAEYEEFAIGRRRFGAYTYSTDSMQTLTRVAVFYTASNLYECAITHLTFTDRELPSLKTLRASNGSHSGTRCPCEVRRVGGGECPMSGVIETTKGPQCRCDIENP